MILAPTLLLNAGSGAAIVRPTFSRDFAGEKTLDNGTGPAITFTRASDATYFDASGTLQTASNDVARFDHDPATGASRGLLIEEARTNSFERSAEFDNAYWSATGLLAFGSGSTADAIAAPDGTTTADLITQNSSNNFHNVTRQITTVSGTAYTMSVFAKAGASSILQLVLGSAGFSVITRAWFDISAGTAGSTAGSPSATSIQNCGNGWYRCSISKTATAADSTPFTLSIASANGASAQYLGDGASGFYLWGAQLEAGAFPTSYIPTTDATATRAADSAVVTPISSFYNTAEGTLFTEAVFRGTSDGTILCFDNNSATERWILTVNTSAIPALAATSSSSTVASIAIGSAVTSTEIIKLAGSVKQDDFQAARGGTLGTADTSGGMPSSIARLQIGRRQSVGIFNGHIRKIAYWPRRLSNTLLQQLTT